jgi:hypothetical protein
MATEKQYAFFKALYDEENERSKILGEHAKNNLALTTLYSAFVLFPFKDLNIISTLEKWVFIIGVTLMLLAILLSLQATNIAKYEAITEPRDIFEKFGDNPPDDAEFFDDRIVDYSVAYERNSAVNDRKAAHLYVARYLLLGGITSHAIYIFLHIH